jgi:triosephosphate isomerase
MTLAQSQAFARDFQTQAKDLLDAVDVVICPPFTAISTVAQALRDDRIQLGGQNIAASTDPARTGQISAELLADLGCRWVMLGHWEVRRHLGDDETSINRKVHAALDASLTPILFIGEGRNNQEALSDVLEGQLGRMLRGCRPEQVSRMAFVYEPEGAIGVELPASPQHVAQGCSLIRTWLRHTWNDEVAEEARIIYGGSVSPEHAADLLACSDLDGLGATRRGRNPITFAEIVRQIARAKGEPS